MASFLKRDVYQEHKGAGAPYLTLTRKQFSAFNADVIGLGDIATPSQSVSALAAIFDLEGFTKFCSQADPHLSVPQFLGRFLSWITEKLKKESLAKRNPVAGKYHLWHRLPFYMKFLGDGLLVLWDVSEMDPIDVMNIVVSLDAILEDYEDLYEKMCLECVDPPSRLRCGIARGTVFSIGGGADFVGPCINMAARLQKLPGLTFAIARRGLDLRDAERSFRKDIVCKKIDVRGFGAGDLMCIRLSEFKKLRKKQRQFYR